MAVAAGEGSPSEAVDDLDILDQAAGCVIEARSLLMTLPVATRPELLTLTDTLLMSLGRRIAAELPPATLRAEAVQASNNLGLQSAGSRRPASTDAL